MGLYDSFTVSYPLPIKADIPDKYKAFIRASIDQDGFQSKDLDCIMDNYYIDNSGALYLEQSSDFEDPDFKIERTKKYFHGHLRIYNFIILDEDDLQSKIWIEYDLKFTDGLLVCATMISPTEKDFY